MVFWVKDEKGASIIEAVILLPLILLVVLASFQLWKLMMLKRALYIGTYQAARFLANNEETFRRLPYSDYCQPVVDLRKYVRWFVEEELKSTSFYSEGTHNLEIPQPQYGLRCDRRSPPCPCGGCEVEVSATLLIPLPNPLDRFDLNGDGAITLHVSRSHSPCEQCGRPFCQ